MKSELRNGNASLREHGEGNYIVEGDLSFASVPGLWEQSIRVFPAVKSGIRVNLEGVKKADSAGLALLVSWKRWAKCNDKTMTFTQVPPKMATLAEINHLTDFLALGS